MARRRRRSAAGVLHDAGKSRLRNRKLGGATSQRPTSDRPLCQPQHAGNNRHVTMLRGTAGTTTVLPSESWSQVVEEVRIGRYRMSSDGSSVTAAVGATTASSGISVERVATLQSSSTLSPSGRTCSSDRRRIGSFSTHRWFRCWWEAFGLVSNSSSCAHGEVTVSWEFAPLMNVPCVRGSGGLPVRALRFMANDYSEECSFIVDAGSPACWKASSGIWLRHGVSGYLLNLERLRLESPLWRQRAAVLVQGGLHYRTRPGMRVPYLRNSTEAGRSFLAQKSRNFRTDYRKRVTRNQRHSEPVLVESHVTSEDVAQALGSVFEVSAKSWK